MKNQCQAVTLASTYSQAHRCLKPAAGSRAPRLCAHHRSMEARRAR